VAVARTPSNGWITSHVAYLRRNWDDILNQGEFRLCLSHALVRAPIYPTTTRRSGSGRRGSFPLLLLVEAGVLSLVDAAAPDELGQSGIDVDRLPLC
jgi:hypothetical protein